MSSNNSYNRNNNIDNNTVEIPASGYTYRVQVGLFRIYDNAVNLRRRLLEQGYMADIKKRGDFYAITVGDFRDLDDAVNLERQLRMLGYNTLLIAE